MKKELKLIILLLSLVILIGGAFLLYDRYADSVISDNLAVTESTVSKNENIEENEEIKEEVSTPVNQNKDTENKEDASQKDTAEEPTLAPDFTVLDKDGNKVKLSDHIGKKVIVNFWASWCGPCKNEMPDFQKAYEAYGDDIVFMMVNMTDGTSETIKSATKFIENAGYSFPVYFDTEESALYAYYVYSIPATYFINSDGTLAAYARGMINEEALTKGIGLMK